MGTNPRTGVCNIPEFSRRVTIHLCCYFPGPNHMPMQGPGPGPNQPPNMPSGSMNMPPSSHGSMGGYNHAVPSSQGIPAQNQMNMTQGQPMGSYAPRPNMNMQPNQGRASCFSCCSVGASTAFCSLGFSNSSWCSSGPMMHQQPPSQQYNMPPGGAGQHYQGQQNPMGMMGQVNQGNHVMGQRPMPPYRPPQQGNAARVSVGVKAATGSSSNKLHFFLFLFSTSSISTALDQPPEI